MNDKFLLRKDIDKSVFNRGFAIPINARPVFSLHLSDGALRHGERRTIKIILNGETHEVTLHSVNFDREKFPDHSEIWQIIYSQNSSFAQSIKKNFAQSFNFFQQGGNNLPEDAEECFFLYATDLKDIFYLEPISRAEVQNISLENEETALEKFFDYPIPANATAALIEKYKLTKIRKLDLNIINYLKDLYDFRCQICGQKVGKIYGASVIECHHIDYFVRSLNHDANNLLIVCPTHHRIIHTVNPIFDRVEKIYRYPNGYAESLKINLHL